MASGRATLESNRALLRKAIFALLTIKIVAAVLQCWAPVNPPHMWRQLSTLGVAERYFSRWFLESELKHPLLPAILESGGAYGVMPMEFPLLNILFAPCFVFGPRWGIVLLHLAFIVFLAGLLYGCWRAWRGIEIRNIPAEYAVLLLPLFSISAFYIHKFMPDFTAALLVTMGCGLLWRNAKQWPAFLLITLGLLIKPPAIVALGVLLLHPDLFRFLMRHIWVLIGSILVTVLYYTKGLGYIETFRDYDNVFYFSMRDPIQEIKSLIAETSGFLKLLFLKFLFPGGLAIALVYYWYWQRRATWRDGRWLLLGVFFLQIFSIVLLDGAHSIMHTYYYMGMAFVGCLILVDLWQACPWRWLHWVWVGVMTIQLGNIVQFDVLAYTRERSFYQYQVEAMQLRRQTSHLPWGKGVPFQSTLEFFPYLGVVFGERQNSVDGDFGFFYSDKPLNTGCRPLAASDSLVIADCRR